MSSFEDGSPPASDSFVNKMGYVPGSPTSTLVHSARPRIILTGLRRSGKTSIQRVVFSNMSPHETLFLESTQKTIKTDVSNSSFVQFQIWDTPGSLDANDPAFDATAAFRDCTAIVFVIDAHDDFPEPLTKLTSLFVKAFKVNPNINFEVFIHKADVLTDDEKIEKQRYITSQVMKELVDINDKIHPSCYLTSIYDHTIWEALSRVVQKCIPQLDVLERLLDCLVQNSRIEKAFLFDLMSKIYIATDSTPVDMQSFELCSDMIDVMIDVSFIYGSKNAEDGSSSAYDSESASIIRLNTGMVLYLRDVSRCLSLVCLLREEHFDKHGLIEYNVNCLRNAIAEIFDLRQSVERKRLERGMHAAPPASRP